MSNGLERTPIKKTKKKNYMMKCVNEEDEVCKKGKIEKNGLGEKNEKEREKNEIIEIVKDNSDCKMHFKYKSNEFYDDFDSLSNLFFISNNKKINNIIINGENRTFSTSPERWGLRRKISKIQKMGLNNGSIILKIGLENRSIFDCIESGKRRFLILGKIFYNL